MSASRFCEQCGATLPPDVRFCEVCGHPVSAMTKLEASPVTPLPANAPAQAKLGRSTWLIAGCVTAIVLIACIGAIAVGGFFYFQSTTQARATPTLLTIFVPSTPIRVPTPVLASPTLPPPTIPSTAVPPPLPPPTIPPTAVPPTLTVPPALPTITPSPTRPSGFSTVTFSTGFDDKTWTPVNPDKVFPFGVRIIYAYWTYSGAVPNTSFECEWLFNNERVYVDTDQLVESSGKSAQWLTHPRSDTLPLIQGTYQFIVRVGGQVVISDSFVIQ